MLASPSAMRPALRSIKSNQRRARSLRAGRPQVTGAGLNSTSALCSFQCSAQVFLRPEATSSIEDTGWELFRLMLDVASGRKKTWAEHWKLHNALVLFNPAPVT